MKKPKIYWFRSDLRLHDQPVINQLFRDPEPFIAFYCLDEAILKINQWGFQNTSSIRLQFLLDHLRIVEAQLAALGVAMVFRRGNAVQTLLAWMKEHQYTELYAERLVGSREQAAEDLLKSEAEKSQIMVHFHRKHTLISLDSLPFDLPHLPDIFTDFRKLLEKHCVPEPVTPMSYPNWPRLAILSSIPSLADLGYTISPADARNPFVFRAGEAAALDRLQWYLWENQHIKNYKLTRNGMLGAQYSSRFSPWLAVGSLSPRLIYAEIKRFEAKHGANESTYWLYLELLWRDYFQFVALKAGSALFKAGGIKNSSKRNGFDPERFKHWCEGRTGQPFIDANMRELLATGWMSNRGRQNVASYLVHDLNQDWRAGAAWFEAQLIDYDPASNYGNWNYIAGIGNDPRENRRFNPEKQAKQYDPDGSYQNLWLS